MITAKQSIDIVNMFSTLSEIVAALPAQHQVEIYATIAHVAKAEQEIREIAYDIAKMRGNVVEQLLH